MGLRFLTHRFLTFYILLALGLGAGARECMAQTPTDATQTGSGAATPLPKLTSKRVFAQLPEVPQAPADMTEEYRLAIADTAKRYSDLYRASKLTDAIAEARKGLVLATAAGRPRDEAEFLKAALYASWLMGDSISGFDYGQRLLARADQFDDDRLRSIAHRVIGTIFNQIKNREKLREHNRLALEAAERAGDANLRIAALNNYGNILMMDGDLAGARKVHYEVLAYREANGYFWDAAGSLTNLGDVAEKAGELEEALRFQERAFGMRVDLEDRRGQVRSLAQIAGVLRKLGRFDEALLRANAAQERAKAIGGHELLNLVYGEIAAIHEARQDFAAALASERLANAEREQMAGEQARVRAAEFATQLDLVRKEKAIEQLDRARALQAADLKLKEAEISRQQAELHAQASAAGVARWQRLGLVGVIMIGLIGVYATISRQRLKIAAERRIHAETRAAMETAEQANALKSRLIGIVSHDIRSPLSGVLALTEDMRTDQPPGKEDERLELIAHQVELVVSLAQDLLDASALESGGMKLESAPVDLNEIARATIDQFSARARTKNQRILFEPAPPEQACLQGDAIKLHQVATNLLSNALKYSPSGATIEVRTGRTADRATIQVVDQGPGVPPDEAAHLFKPFSQLSARPTAGESSHGLGLSIAHQLVQLHGGTIRVESVASRRGSIFIVELPVDHA